MGGTFYSSDNRSLRAAAASYATNSIDQNFKQNVEKKIHESMNPSGISFRESRDSDVHPNTVPVILALDVTGSMGRIPQQLVISGLPKMMSGIIQHGIKDPALLFLAVGDTQVDHYPLQVGQFESGDEELDTWLTRTYIEKGGGANEGESYLLAWYFAAMHTRTDAWDKRKKKGFLFTIGDEPCLKTLPASAIGPIMGTSPQEGYTAAGLLKAAQERWDVYHLHIMEGNAGPRSLGYWQDLLGQNCIEVKNHETVPDVIATIVAENSIMASPVSSPVASKEDEFLL